MQLGIGVLTIISTPPSYGGRDRAAPGAQCLMVVCSRNVLSLTRASSVPKMERISPKKWLLKRGRAVLFLFGAAGIVNCYRVTEITTSPPNSFCPRPLLILARSGFLLFYPEGHRRSSAGGGRWVGASLPGRNARLTTTGTVHRERRPAPQGKIARRRIWQGNLPLSSRPPRRCQTHPSIQKVVRIS
jgi:hypothetical protein